MLGLSLLFCSFVLIQSTEAYAEEQSSTDETTQSTTISSTESTTESSNEVYVEESVTEDSTSLAEDLGAKIGEKELSVEKGKTFSYRLAFRVSNEQIYKKIMLQDKLESVLTIHSVSVSVLDSNKKEQIVTEQGKLTVDKENNIIEWVAKEPEKYFGSFLFLDIEASIKEDADLSKYEDKNGLYVIPNMGSMITDGETTDTDEVIVTTPVPEKPIDPEKPEKPTNPNSETPEKEYGGGKLPQTGYRKVLSVVFPAIFLILLGGVGYFMKRKYKGKTE